MDGETTAEVLRRPIVLIVHDTEGFIPSMCEHFQGRLGAQRVGTIRAARKLLDGPRRVVGAIITPQLSDGNGFDLLPDLRTRCPTLPILLISGECDVNSINTAHLEGVPIVARQNCGPNLRHFALQVQTAMACKGDSLGDAMAQIAHRTALTEREQQLLTVAVHGIPRARIALKLGLSENTVKSQIRSLLDKTSQPSLSEVVWLVHRHSETL